MGKNFQRALYAAAVCRRCGFLFAEMKMSKNTSTAYPWRKRVEKKIHTVITRLMLATNDVEKAQARVWIGLWNELLWGNGSSARLGNAVQGAGLNQT
jgi:hypothetical protein